VMAASTRRATCMASSDCCMCEILDYPLDNRHRSIV
jgi:hypothetical protein